MMRTILNKREDTMSGLLLNTTLAAVALWLLASLPH